MLRVVFLKVNRRMGDLAHARVCAVDRTRRGCISWRMENRGIFSVSLHHPSRRQKASSNINLLQIEYVFIVWITVFFLEKLRIINVFTLLA